MRKEDDKGRALSTTTEKTAQIQQIGKQFIAGVGKAFTPTSREESARFKHDPVLSQQRHSQGQGAEPLSTWEQRTARQPTAEQREASAGFQEQAAAKKHAGSNLPKTENIKSGGIDWSVYVRSPEQMAASTAEARAQQQQTRENIAQKGQAEGGWADIGPQDFGKAIAKDVANYQGIKREATRARESGTPGAGDAWKQFMEAQNNLVGQALSWIEGQVQRQSGKQFRRSIATGPGRSRLSYTEPIEQYRARVQALSSVASSVLPQELRGAVQAFGDDLTYQRAAEDRASADWRTVLADQRMRESEALADKRWKADFGLRQAEIADAHNRGSAFPATPARGNIDPLSEEGIKARAMQEYFKREADLSQGNAQDYYERVQALVQQFYGDPDDDVDVLGSLGSR